MYVTAKETVKETGLLLADANYRILTIGSVQFFAIPSYVHVHQHWVEILFLANEIKIC